MTQGDRITVLIELFFHHAINDRILLFTDENTLFCRND